MDRTVKIRAFSEEPKSGDSPGNRAEENIKAAELSKAASAQLEEERSKSLELLKTITQLRESLKQEQAKSTDLEAKFNRLAILEEQQLAKKNAQIEEEKKNSLELMRIIEQLRESLKQYQAGASESASKTTELEAKAKELAALEAKVKDLTGVLNMISRIAAAGKLDSHP